MKLSQLIYILKHFETCYPEAEVQLDLDVCEDPKEIIIEMENEQKTIKITQGNCGL
jgi:hypothetical protein